MEYLKGKVEEVQSALNNISSLIDEREGHIAQIIELQKFNTKLLEEQGVKASPERELRLVMSGYEQGRDSVLIQLRDEDYETEVDIDEQIEENGFEVRFCNSVDTRVSVNNMLEELYEDYTQESIETASREIINQVNEEN